MHSNSYYSFTPSPPARLKVAMKHCHEALHPCTWKCELPLPSSGHSDQGRGNSGHGKLPHSVFCYQGRNSNYRRYNATTTRTVLSFQELPGSFPASRHGLFQSCLMLFHLSVQMSIKFKHIVLLTNTQCFNDILWWHFNIIPGANTETLLGSKTHINKFNFKLYKLIFLENYLPPHMSQGGTGQTNLYLIHNISVRYWKLVYPTI